MKRNKGHPETTFCFRVFFVYGDDLHERTGAFLGASLKKQRNEEKHQQDLFNRKKPCYYFLR